MPESDARSVRRTLMLRVAGFPRLSTQFWCVRMSVHLLFGLATNVSILRTRTTHLFMLTSVYDFILGGSSNNSFRLLHYATFFSPVLILFCFVHCVFYFAFVLICCLLDFNKMYFVLRQNTPKNEFIRTVHLDFCLFVCFMGFF